MRHGTPKDPDMPRAHPAKKPSPLPADPRKPEQIRARDLIIDHRAQRDINDDRVRQIVAEFTWAMFEAPTVVSTARGFVVVEGQHRVRAVQALDPNMMVWCMILPSVLTTPEQAQLALDIVRGRNVHSAYDKWMNALHAEHPHEVEANKVLEDMGLHLAHKPSTMAISCVATIKAIVHGHQQSPEDGAELLMRTLMTIMEAWPTFDHDSATTRWDRDILLAVANMHRKWWDELDSDRLAGVVRVKPAVQWRSIGHGDDRLPPAKTLFDRFVADYNRGLRSGRLK
jgi:hypothetical protein